MSHYEELGVPKDASRDQIKKAYRRRAQKEHPDKGGDTEKFYALQRAYDVLGDDARRAHYDRHGTDGQPDRQSALMQRLAALLMQVVEANDTETVDIVALMKTALVHGKDATKNAIKQQEMKAQKYEKAQKRIIKKSGENILSQMLDGQIGLVKRGIEMGKVELAMIEELQKIVAEYQYRYESNGRGQAATLQAMFAQMGRNGTF